MNLQRISIRVDEDTLKWLNEMAELSGGTLSLSVRQVLRKARLNVKKTLKDN